MSADNGIYILVTPKGDKFEYRVAHLQAVENLYYSGQYMDIITDDPALHIIEARKMWGFSKVFFNKDKALREAVEIWDRKTVVEYGIQFIEIDREF